MLSNYYFDDNSVKIGKSVNDIGEIWVAFYLETGSQISLSAADKLQYQHT